MITAMCWGSRVASKSARRRSSSSPDGLIESGIFTRLIPRIPCGVLRTVCALFDILSASKRRPHQSSKANTQEQTTQHSGVDFKRKALWVGWLSRGTMHGKARNSLLGGGGLEYFKFGWPSPAPTGLADPREREPTAPAVGYGLS